jgi:hypothetical protein
VPEALLREMREPPLCHLISHYYSKPVNFEHNPFAPINAPYQGKPKQYQGENSNQVKQPYKKQEGGAASATESGNSNAFQRGGKPRKNFQD